MQRAIKKKVCKHCQTRIALWHGSTESKLLWRLLTCVQCALQLSPAGWNPPFWQMPSGVSISGSALSHPVLSHFWQIPLLQFSHPWQLNSCRQISLLEEERWQLQLVAPFSLAGDPRGNPDLQNWVQPAKVAWAAPRFSGSRDGTPQPLWGPYGDFPPPCSKLKLLKVGFKW